MSLLVSFFIVHLWAFSAVSAATPQKQKSKNSIEAQFNEQWRLIQNYALHPPADTARDRYACFEKILRGGIALCLNDRFSTYHTKEEMEELNVHYAGVFGGVGIQVIESNGRVTIVTPISETPADRSGALVPGDIIIEVDGENVEQQPLIAIMKKIRGPLGLSVTIRVERNGKKQQPVTLIREAITMQAITVEDLDDHVTYIKIKDFIAPLPRQFLQAIMERLVYESPEGVTMMDPTRRKFVFNLRNNPGGLLETVKEMGYFFSNNPDDIVVTVRSLRDEEITTVGSLMRQYPYSAGILRDITFVMIVNEGTASAAELFTALMKDLKGAETMIIGTTTFGKGSVQRIFQLNDGGGLRLTIQKYFVGNSLFSPDQKGIIPDYRIEDKISDELADLIAPKKADPENDPPLKKAFEVLKNLPAH